MKRRSALWRFSCMEMPLCTKGNVSEALGFTSLRDYTTGGTVHIVVNNQIGFTTLPKEATSSTYTTDVLKQISAPIFHVNGDHPEMVVRACEIAAEYRQRFACDAVVNVWVYRRHGHNEQDIPELTQPLMYSYINAHASVVEKYGLSLVNDNVMSRREYSDTLQDVFDGYILRGGFGKSKSRTFARRWSEVENLEEYTPPVSGKTMHPATGVEVAFLKTISEKLFTLPETFSAHPYVSNLMSKRKASLEEGKGIQWATAEGPGICDTFCAKDTTFASVART